MIWEERKKIYNKEYYDGNLEGHYREWWWTDISVWGPRARVVYEAFRPESVLVCGCAKGSLVNALVKQYNIDAYGFDLSEYAITTTPYNEIRDRLLIHDLALHPLPFLEHRFDLSVCFDFLEHQDNDHIHFVCDEISRVTRTNILIRQPFYIIEDITKYIDLDDMAVSSRMEILAADGINQFHADSDNIEHPTTIPKDSVVSMFPEFKSITIESKHYDVKINNVPILPFWDTLVLRKNIDDKPVYDSKE